MVNHLYVYDECVEAPDPPMYENLRGKHIMVKYGNWPGDRTEEMTCKYCGNILWGFYEISEQEEPWQ